MAAADGDGRMVRGKVWLRDFASRWTGTRTFIVSAAILFLALAWLGALHPIIAFVSFAVLAGISASRFMVTGETAPIRIGSRGEEGRSGALGAGRTMLALLHRLPDPLMVVDDGGRVAFVNEAAEALVGKASSGRHVATVLRSAPLIAAIAMSGSSMLVTVNALRLLIAERKLSAAGPNQVRATEDRPQERPA